MTDEAFDMRTIEGCIGWGLLRDKTERARVSAELARLRRIAAAAKKLTEQLPPNSATLSLAPFRLSSYGTALLYTLRTAVERVGDE